MVPSKRTLIYFLGIPIAFGVFVGAYWLSFCMSFNHLEAGIRGRNVAALEKYIDWPVIREQLRSEIRGAVLRRVYEDKTAKQSGPWYLFGTLLAGTITPTMVDQLVDAFVTPQGLVDLLGRTDKPVDLTITPIGLTDLDEYTIELSKVNKAATNPPRPINAVLRREGLTWRVVHLRFPPGEAPWEAVASPIGPGLELAKIAPARIAGGLIVEGDITNTGSIVRNVPRLRIALRDPDEKEKQFKIIDPPTDQLAPGETSHFKTSFDHLDEAATGVLVTFAPR